jgi:hypothetical protein
MSESKVVFDTRENATHKMFRDFINGFHEISNHSELVQKFLSAYTEDTISEFIEEFKTKYKKAQRGHSPTYAVYEWEDMLMQIEDIEQDKLTEAYSKGDI